MWAFLLGLLPFLQDIVNWINGVEQAQTNANTAEQTAETANENNGAQSVADQASDDAQNAALDAIENQLQNPTPVVVIPPLPKGNGQ